MHIADDNNKGKKESVIARYEKNLALGSGACKQEKTEEGIRSQLEPMIDYKYPTIASGATPIGSAERAPDRK
jgi:hypothetical protein